MFMKSKCKTTPETRAPEFDGAPDVLTIRLPKPFRFRGALIRTLKFPRPCEWTFSDAVAGRRFELSAGTPPEKQTGVPQLLTEARIEISAPALRPLLRAALKIEENAAAIDEAVYAAALEAFYSAVARADEARKTFNALATTAKFFAECFKQHFDDLARERAAAAKKGEAR